MVDPMHRSTAVLRSAFLVALVLTAGCHYVKQDDMEAQLARVREEMRAGDDRVAGQVTALDQKTEARISALEASLHGFEEEFGARVERIEGSLRIQTPITYNFNRSELEPSEVPILDRLASILKEQYPDALLTVEGFTDPAGSPKYNQQLGMRRAEGVKSYLVSTGGMPEDQVRAVSYGEQADRLVTSAQGPGDLGRENRRTVIVIDQPGSARRGDRPITQ